MVKVTLWGDTETKLWGHIAPSSTRVQKKKKVYPQVIILMSPRPLFLHFSDFSVVHASQAPGTNRAGTLLL